MPFRIKVLLAFEICAALGTVIRPFWGLLFLILLTLLRPQDDRPNMADLHIPMVITWALIIATVSRVSSLAGRVGFALRNLSLFIALYVLMVLAAFVNDLTPYSKYQIGDSLTILIVSCLILIWVSTRERLTALVWTMLLSGLYYVQLVVRNPTFMQEQIGQSEFDRLAFRQSINFGNPNFLAILMVILIFLALALLVRQRRLWRKVILAMALLGYLYVFLRCQSRGASLGLAAGVLIYWLMQRRKLLVAAVMAISVTIGLAFLVPAGYLQRLQTIVYYQEDKSATGRLEMWAISRDVIADNPLFGIGPGNFALRYPTMSQHNAYLQVASEVGIPALLLYIALLLSGYRSLWVVRRLTAPRARDLPDLRSFSEGLFCALVAITVQGFFTGFAFREFVYITLALTYCLREMVLSEETSEEPAQPEVVAPASYAES
ncbi:MAG TPA: O-antigen ligase family protein [Terriglobales bacterium]|nr:O-antigen ligase family protein [Terriglobales bacterium]